MVRNRKKTIKTIFSRSAVYRKRKILLNKCERSARIIENENIEQDQAVEDDNVNPDNLLSEERVVNGDVIEPEESEEMFTNDMNTNLQNRVARWACSPTLCATDVNRMLRILHEYFSHLPIDSRTLKQTPRSVTKIEMKGGLYVHIGVRLGLERNVSLISTNNERIRLNIGIDGLPILRNQLTPILGNINNTGEVFVIGLFYGKSKPQDIEEFLTPFITEMEDVMQNGFAHNNRLYSVSIRTVVCDAVEKAAILAIKGHAGKIHKILFKFF
jgi:hypothetical protein